MTRILPDKAVSPSDLALWEKAGDQVDQLIAKTRMMVVLTLSGAMRWDIRNPGMAFADRFVLVS